MDVMVMTDGRRDCITRSIDSLFTVGPVTRWLIHDDSGEPAYRWWLRDTFPDWEIVSTGKRQGFAGAYRSAWKILSGSQARYCFVTEDDFLYHQPVNLEGMAALLEIRNLTQVALIRQAWNSEEQAAGGLVQMGGYTEHREDGRVWLEHRKFFTTNPSVYRTELCKQGWPQTPHSEGVLTHRLLKQGAVFGYWGTTESVEHIGTERVGRGY